MTWLYILTALVTFCLMEGITWLTHKYVMHGFLWFLHKDHHQPTKGFFEKNDFFFLIFAIPGWLCIMLGWQHLNWFSVSIGSGITLYGIAYFLVHEIIIHQRFNFFSNINNHYLKTIRWAHKMHHSHREKDNGESFGMLFFSKKYCNKIKRDMHIQKKASKKS